MAIVFVVPAGLRTRLTRNYNRALTANPRGIRRFHKTGLRQRRPAFFQDLIFDRFDQLMVRPKRRRGAELPGASKDQKRADVLPISVRFASSLVFIL
jgi:hypothetical protein